MISKWRVLFAAVAVLAQGTAFGQTKLTLGYTAVTVFASAFAAKEEGYFQKRGLDVELQLITVGPMVPPGLQAGGLQIGGLTPSLLLQAADGGLDLVSVAGAAVTTLGDTEAGLVARAGAGIKTPQDLVGKKVAIPGLNALLHVLMRKWLIDNGVDWRKVSFIEVAMPQIGDVLKGGAVDAGISAGPLLRGILNSGSGTLVSHYMKDTPSGEALGLYAVTREWAAKNPAAVKAFREALAEGVTYVEKNLDGARKHVGKFIKLPPPVLAVSVIPKQTVELREAQLRWWMDIMRTQDMLRGNTDVSKLILR